MFEMQVVMKLKTGLQARPAAMFVQEANRFQSEILIEKDGRAVNAKSIMGIMSLAVAANTEIIIKAEGKDEQEAVHELAGYLSKQ